MRGLGVDGAGTKGWVGIVVDDAGFAAAHVSPTLVGLVELAEVDGPVDAIGVDIPIGLVDGPFRSADAACRVAVGPRRASVFPAPHPAVVHLTELAEVNEYLHGHGFPGMSMQGFRLFDRIREVAGMAGDARLIEVFPETSFRALAGSDLASSKKTWNGSARRRSVLAAASPPIVLPDALGRAGDVGTDDLLDAAAAGWSTWRYAHGRADALGDPTEVDAVTGRRIAVWV